MMNLLRLTTEGSQSLINETIKEFFASKHSKKTAVFLEPE